MTFSTEPLKNSEIVQTSRVSWATVIRHCLAILLIAVAWTKLRWWYAEENTGDYVVFATCFIGALIIATGEQIRNLWRYVPAIRLLLTGIILLLFLPWSEWFERALPNAREDWSRQIFEQCCFIYGVFLFFGLFSPLKSAIRKIIALGIEKLCKTSFSIWIPAVFFCFCSAIVLFVYDRTPLVQDSAAHIFQAKIFLAGKLVAPEPPIPPVFSSPGDMLVLHNGKWFSSYLPGFSLLLALASILRLEWLICPLLGAIAVYIWIQYALRYHSTRVALVFGILCIFSPMLILMYSNLMVHTAELFYSSAIIYLCRRQTDQFSTRRMIGISAVLFFSMITRGFSILPFLAPILLLTIIKSTRPNAIRFVAFAGASILTGLIFIGIYQQQTTGSFWVPAYTLEATERPFFGFHGEYYHQRHSPLRGLENVSNSLIAMNAWLSGWPSGSVFFLLLFLLIERKIQAWDVYLFLGCLSVAMFYFFFVIQDLVIGPRYWFAMVPILLLFVVRAILDAIDRNSAIVPLALFSFVASLIFFYPHYVRMYDPHNLPVGELHKALSKARSTKAVVILDPKVEQNLVNWNDPFLSQNVIIANRLAINNVDLYRAFPGRMILYFRQTLEQKKFDLVTSYQLMPDPDPRPAGSFSVQQFMLLVQSSNGFTSFDIFDSSYVNLFKGLKSSDCLAFLNGLQALETGDREYKRALKSSIAHLARAILSPKAAFETTADAWQQHFNPDEFRQDVESAMTDAVRAGEVGVTIQEQIGKIRARIDTDQDQQLSDAEIFRYVSRKIRSLETQE